MAKRNSANLPMSTTHAGGIQPSASFFRPSKPSQYSPPATPDIPLNTLPHEEGSVHESEAEAQFVTLKTIKRSREPLLPGPGPHSASSRNSMSRDPPLSPTKLVRNSVDRVLTMSRGLSFDSVTKSGLRNSKLGDEESQQHHRKRYHNSQRDSGRSSFSLAPASVVSLSASASSPSPDPHPLSFIPTPPVRDPPLSAVPLINHLKNRPYRRWELHPSRNRFFLNGRIRTGGDPPWAFIASFALLLCIASCWFATAGVWWWRNVNPALTIGAAYLTLLTISTMLTTFATDPGILPRNLDRDPPYSASPDGKGPVPMPRDLKVRSDIVRVKYCPTCRIYRPPRSSHCKMCDNCVDGCDHHCQWVNNCIGRRNYPIFFVLLMSTTVTVIYLIVTSALHLYYYNGQEKHSFRKTLTSPMGIGSALSFSLSLIVIWPIGALLLYHVRLLLLNVTTIEQIRNQAHKSVPNSSPPSNPFSHGSWRRNVVATLCRPTGLSWLDARGLVTEDRRELNPASVSNDEGVGREG